MMTSRKPRVVLTIVVPLMLVAVPLAGCVGSGQTTDTGDAGDDDQGSSSVPEEGFASFDDAMAAEGQAIEADPLPTVEQKRSEAVEVQGGVAYEESYTFDVEREDVSRVFVEARLGQSVPETDTVTVTLLDPDGEEAASVTLQRSTTTAENTEAILESDNPRPGEWTVQVEGTIISARYTVDMRVQYPTQPDLTLKLLEPLEPISPGSHDFVFLLTDGDEEPVTNATGSLESWMTSMDHGGNETGEEDPEHEEFGVYRGVISPSMAGEWEVRVELDTPDQEGIRFAVPMTVEE